MIRLILFGLILVIMIKMIRRFAQMFTGEITPNNTAISRYSSTRLEYATNPVAHAVLTNKKKSRLWVPDALDTVIRIWAPELKRTESYWQIEISSVPRVAVSALKEGTLIVTSNATTIMGTESENFEEIKTLGTARITFFNEFYIEAHVTRSKSLVIDGILGAMQVRDQGFVFDDEEQTLHHPYSYNSIPFFPARHYFPDFNKIIRENNLLKEKNERASVLKRRLQQARRYLPPKVNDDSRSPVIDVLNDYSDCLFLPNDTILPTKLLKYPIKSIPHDDIIAFPQPEHSPGCWYVIECIVTDLLRQDILRVSTSPYSSPVGLMEKKPEVRGIVDSFRLYPGYSKLNNRSEWEPYPIPEIYDAVDQLHGSKYFSVLDLASGSYHIPIEPQDCWKTAFTTKSGHYEFVRVPAGLKNGGSYMQRLMNKVLEGIGKGVFVCYDDMLIHAPTIGEHEVIIRKVFDRLRAHGLKLQPGKCQLFSSQVLYLGFLITDEGIRPDPAKIEKLRSPQRPDSPKALQSWLGLLSTHKRFLRGYAGRAQPMWDLLKNDHFHWTVEAHRNYVIFQQMLTGKLLLRYPDWNRPFIIQIGFDDYGIYAGLMQKASSKQGAKAIAWDSRTNRSVEALLDAHEREKLVFAWSLESFRRYVQNTKPPVKLMRNLSMRK